LRKEWRVLQHILPAEYFQAACAEGFLISAEFPLGFGGPAKACWPHAMEEWSAIIKQLRNYPCVLDYTMANEQPWNVTSGVGIANRMYETAKSLDPTRPVLTSDGMVPAAGALASNFGPEDFRTTSFRDNLPLNPDPAPEDQHIFAIDQPMMAPVIDHEMGNFGAENAFLSGVHMLAFLYSKQLFHQDRLGTNIGKVESSCRTLPDEPRYVRQWLQE
jgi:hypothetical protein